MRGSFALPHLARAVRPNFDFDVHNCKKEKLTAPRLETGKTVSVKFAVLAITLALLSVTAPAHAAYVETLDLNNVGFSGGDTVNGTVYINTNDLPAYSINSDQNQLSVDGLYFFVRTGLTSNSVSALFYNGPTTQSPLIETLAVNLADLPDLSVSDFTLIDNGQPQLTTYGVSGEVSCVSGCSVAATPLPSALPMFTAAALALAGFAAWLRRSN